MTPILPGQQLVGLAGTGERGMAVGAHEHDRGPGALRAVARVSEAPATEEGVIGEELVVVVRGAGGEVDLDEQVEMSASAFRPGARVRGRA